MFTFIHAHNSHLSGPLAELSPNKEAIWWKCRDLIHLVLKWVAIDFHLEIRTPMPFIIRSGVGFDVLKKNRGGSPRCLLINGGRSACAILQFV